ncbi:MAG: hypothetical protein HPY45_02965 [Anaerolineae bacterium]|nr:hypothetical protein [Anaerolineae bacterium]
MKPDFIAFGIILDDIVLADGRTSMGVLGGGGPQSAFGMRLWSPYVGLVSGVGEDFPEEAERWIKDFGIDQAGIRRNPVPTARAWQVVEENGKRTQVWRVSPEVIRMQLMRKMDRIPESYRDVRGAHIGIHPLDADLDFVQEMRALGCLMSIETFKPSERLLTRAEALRLFEQADIFSPNLEEGYSMFGGDTPQGLLRRMLDLGARSIALRMGQEGSLLVHGGSRLAVQVPSVSVEVVDPVGAGNAYCGGFLVGWVETGDLITAGLYAAVSASFLVQQVGLPPFYPGMAEEAKLRLERLRPGVREIKL